MASSDNVVRAGLTPNYVDLPLFMDMVDCTSRPVRKLKLKGRETTEYGCHITTFAPPITDFAVAMLQVPDHVTSCVLSSMDRASITICIDGIGHIVNRTVDGQIPVMAGSVLFISANEEVTLHKAGTDMLLFRAYAG